MTSFEHNLTIIKKKGKEGMKIPLESLDEVTFGRAESCNIRINKPSISSQHTRIFYDKDGLVRRATRAARPVTVTRIFRFSFFFFFRF